MGRAFFARTKFADIEMMHALNMNLCPHIYRVRLYIYIAHDKDENANELVWFSMMSNSLSTDWKCECAIIANASRHNVNSSRKRYYSTKRDNATIFLSIKFKAKTGRVFCTVKSLILHTFETFLNAIYRRLSLSQQMRSMTVLWKIYMIYLISLVCRIFS